MDQRATVSYPSPLEINKSWKINTPVKPSIYLDNVELLVVVAESAVGPVAQARARAVDDREPAHHLWSKSWLLIKSCTFKNIPQEGFRFLRLLILKRICSHQDEP